VRRAASRLKEWNADWRIVVLTSVLAFGISAALSVLVLDRDTGYALAMAGAVALGTAVGQSLRVYRVRRPRPPAWPTSTPPAPGRPD
jgi:hypothetical protein